MKKSILTILALTILFTACKKDETQPKNQELIILTGSIWYGPGSNAGTTATFYNHFSFISSSEVEMYNSYLIGKKTNDYIGTLKYTIDDPKALSPAIHIVGKDGFDTNVDVIVKYDRATGTLLSGGVKFTRAN